MIAAAICLTVATALAGLFFFPWAELSIASDTPIEEIANGQVDQSGIFHAAHTIGIASGWELTTADVTMVTPPAGKRHNVDESLFVARPWLIAGLIVPVLIVGASGVVLITRRYPCKAGLLITMAACVGVFITRMAMRVDFLDDLLAPLANTADGVDDIRAVIARSLMHTSEGSGVWASLVLYVMLVFFGVAMFITGRTLPDQPVE